jgi:glycolate oxidase FAD binding subunit
LDFFKTEHNLWRIAMPPAAPQPRIDGHWLIDWGGAQRWLTSAEDAETIFQKTAELGGHASRFRSANGGLFQPLAPALAKLQQKVKAAFDPHGIFNRGRLYPDW